MPKLPHADLNCRLCARDLTFGDEAVPKTKKGMGMRQAKFGLATSVAFVLLLLFGEVGSAETVAVAPGVQVTKKTFSAPSNEQPFFGFVEKTAAQRAADDSFVASIVQATGSRQKAFDAAIKSGWSLISSGNIPEATRRFNQAYLLAPDQSAIYHSFAVIVSARFSDNAYAEELFKIARSRPAPLGTLGGDYGRFLLVAKRPKDALPILQQAVIDTPDFPDAWSNLAWARLQTGDRAAACDAAAAAAKLKASAHLSSDLTMLRRSANCS